MCHGCQVKKLENNYAFIDIQNLNLAIKSCGWKVDFRRFRIFLKEKYSIEKAYVFTGYLEENEDIYHLLHYAGYVCVFKPVLFTSQGVVKGNCDGELILQAMIDYTNYDKAVVVTGDGDFYCLVKHLVEQNKLKVLFVPNRRSYSALLKHEIFKLYIYFVSDLREKLEYKKEKAP